MSRLARGRVHDHARDRYAVLLHEQARRMVHALPQPIATPDYARRSGDAWAGRRCGNPHPHVRAPDVPFFSDARLHVVVPALGTRLEQGQGRLRRQEQSGGRVFAGGVGTQIHVVDHGHGLRGRNRCPPCDEDNGDRQPQRPVHHPILRRGRRIGNAPLHGIWSGSIDTRVMNSSQASKAPCPTSLVVWKSPSLDGTRSSASSATVGPRSYSWDETRNTNDRWPSRCCARSSRWPWVPSGSCGKSSSRPGSTTPTSCRYSIREKRPAFSTTSCPTSRASRYATGWSGSRSCRWRRR